jgi:hypothetical protein
MSYGFYKVLHLIGILGVFISLGALILHSYNGNAKNFKGRKMVVITHGVSLAVVFVAGFGLMARLNMMGASWPLWIYLKIGIWLALGGIVAVISRKAEWAMPLWYSVLIIGGCAAWVANYKP